jgi:hypothetical protein
MTTTYTHSLQRAYNRMSHIISQLQPESSDLKQTLSPNPTAAQHGSKTTISSHVLNTHLGIPGRGIHLKLQKQDTTGL